MNEAPVTADQVRDEIEEFGALAIDTIHDLQVEIRKLREENAQLHKNLALMEMRLEQVQG